MNDVFHVRSPDPESGSVVRICSTDPDEFRKLRGRHCPTIHLWQHFHKDPITI